MIKNIFASALLLAVVPAVAQYDFTSIESGDIVFTDGDLDTALTGINTGSLDRNSGISIDSDNNTLVLFTRNGGAPFGDYLVKYDLVGATGPTSFGGNLDSLDADDGDFRFGSGGLGVEAGNGEVLLYDFQNTAGTSEDELHSIAIADGTYNQVQETGDLSGIRLFRHIDGDNWLVGYQTSFGGNGTLRVYDASVADIVNAPVLATATGTDGVFDIDVVDTGSGFDAYFVDDNAIFRVTDILGTPGTPVNVTPASFAGSTIQDMLAVDEDTFIIFDNATGNIRINDGGVPSTYSFANIATATGAANFTLDPFFIYSHLEKREVIDGFELYLTNNAAFTGSQVSADASVVVVKFGLGTPETNVSGWSLYN